MSGPDHQKDSADVVSAAEEVGYGKPPVSHRFRPGQSGNPSGRVRGVRNLKSDLADELAETIVVHEGGVAATLTKQRAFVKRLCAKALSGEPRAMAQLAQLTMRLLPSETDDDQTDGVADGDETILARYLARALADVGRSDEQARETPTDSPIDTLIDVQTDIQTGVKTAATDHSDAASGKDQATS